MTKRPVHLFGPLHRRTTAGFVVALLILLASIADASVAGAASTLRVSAQGDCLRLRDGSGLSGAVLGCVPDGSSLVYAGQQSTADGLDWTLVRWGEVIGWAASQYLVVEVAAPSTSVASVEANRTGVALPLREPPTGGVTVGLVSFVSPRAVVAAQAFEVTSLSVYDFATQRFLTYIPGSPVNAIENDPLPAGTAVFVRRRGDLPATLPAPTTVTSTAGTPAILAAPAPGATVAAIAGTGDVAAFVAAQPFAVESMSAWDTASQRWLTYIAGAPEFVSTLRAGLMRADAVVFVKRSAAPTTAVPAPAPAPAAVTPSPASTMPTPAATAGYNTVSYGPATITFYYCSSGTRNGAVGDGGGFCGYMANGQRVHEGAASCAAAYMGQRFLIAGDPLNRVYTCEDTGGAVTASHRDIWFADSDAGGDWWRAVGRTAEILVILP